MWKLKQSCRHIDHGAKPIDRIEDKSDVILRTQTHDEDDLEFVESWKESRGPIVIDMSKWLDYFIQYDMLFKGRQMCIHRSSMRENLIKEEHSGG